MSNSTQNDWEKRFDEEFPNLRMHYSDGVAPCEDDVKAFIAKELADARKEVGNGIEKMYLSVADKDPRYDTVEEIQAYNQAIYEILATLKEEKI